MLSASGLSRARYCVWWVSNEPDVRIGPSVSATKGSRVHTHVENIVKLCIDEGAEGALDYIERIASELTHSNDMGERQIENEALHIAAACFEHLKELCAMRLHAENAFAIDMIKESADFVSSNGHRDYSNVNPEYQIPMTVDLWWVDGDTLYVRDWKTGRAEYVDPVASDDGSANNCQMHACGTAVWLAMREELSGVVDKVCLQLAFLSTGGVEFVDSATFEPSVLVDTFFDRFHDVWVRSRSESEEPHIGSHCTWRSSASICPKASSVSASAIDQSIVPLNHGLKSKYVGKDFTTKVRDEDHASWLKGALDVVNTCAKQVRSALEAYATMNGGIPTTDKRRWGEVKMRSVSIDISKCVDLFTPQEIESVAPRKNPSASAVRRALGTKRARAIIEQAEARNGLIKKTYSQFKNIKEKSNVS